jgi:hypothetical protein
MYRALVGRVKNIKLGPQDTIRKVLKCKWLKCPRIVHLDLICMNYDQKKGWESKIENLTANHKSFENKGQIRFDWGVLYIVENIFLRAIIRSKKI